MRLRLGLKGVAVGALYHGGVCLVGANVYLREGAVVLALAVMGALGNGAADALVCVSVVHHFKFTSLYFGFAI